VCKNLPLHCLFYVTMHICLCFYFHIARDVATVLLIFVNFYDFPYTLSHAHTEALTVTHKHFAIFEGQTDFFQLEMPLRSSNLYESPKAMHRPESDFLPRFLQENRMEKIKCWRRGSAFFFCSCWRAMLLAKRWQHQDHV